MTDDDNDPPPSPASVYPTQPTITAQPVRFPSPESNSRHDANGGNASPRKRESNRNSGPAQVEPVQFPFTRSNSLQTHENQQIFASAKLESCAWDTEVGHKGASESTLTTSKHSVIRPRQWVTQLGHNRPVRGLSLRGSDASGWCCLHGADGKDQDQDRRSTR